MVKVALASSLLVAAEAATLAVTWSDCGDAATHTKVQSFEPDTIVCGEATTLTGTGVLDEDVTAATMSAVVKAQGVKVASCSGDATTDVVCKLPLGTGTFTIKAQSLPLKAGTATIVTEVKVSSVIPPSLAKTATHVTSVSNTGDKILCMDVNTVKAVSGLVEWGEWKQEHGRVYDDEEDNFRRSVFDANMVRAAELQKLNPKAEFGATQFSDWTEEEFQEILLNYKPANATLPEADLSQLPAHVESSKDWTGTATTPVKDQGSCGSCWAFSATEQIESDLMLQHGVNEVLAPQQLVNCRKNGGSYREGCMGGNVFKAYEVIESMGGMNRESDYPYRGMATLGRCKYQKNKAAAQVLDYKYVGRNDESAMKSYVGSTGPLSVCVAAGAWHSYKSGVLTSCDTNVDHCVQVVGYGDDSGMSYWKVRNSWNTKFGEAGHIRIQIGKDLCKISSEPTKVTVQPVSEADVVVL